MEIQRRTGQEPIPEDQPVLGSEEAEGMAVVKPTDLPSRCLPYPKGAAIFYRPYNFDELNTFSDSLMSKSERTKFVMQGILCKGVDPGDLTVADFLYLGLLRKVSVFQTGKFTVTFPPDPRTGRKAHTETVNIADIGVEDLQVPALPAAIDVCGKEMLFSPLTVSRMGQLLDKLDDEADEEYEEAKTAAAEQGDVDVDEIEYPEPRNPTSSELMAYQCVNMEPEEALPLIIKGGVGITLAALQQLDDLFKHKVSPVTATWKQKPDAEGEPEKEYTETVEIQDPTALVWPFRGSEDYGRDAIRFGVQGSG